MIGRAITFGVLVGMALGLLPRSATACGTVEMYASQYLAFRDPYVQMEALAGLLCVTPLPARMKATRDVQLLAIVLKDALSHRERAIRALGVLVYGRYVVHRKGILAKEMAKDGEGLAELKKSVLAAYRESSRYERIAGRPWSCTHRSCRHSSILVDAVPEGSGGSGATEILKELPTKGVPESGTVVVSVTLRSRGAERGEKMRVGLEYSSGRDPRQARRQLYDALDRLK